MPRTLWVVRHAEREDITNHKWILSPTKNPHGLKADNSPLSQRGHHQANELAERFANQPLDHVISSPFERTMQTASAVVARLREVPELEGAGKREQLLGVKVEPGLQEAFYLFQQPFSSEDIEALKNRFQALVDPDYSQVFCEPLLLENYAGCRARVQKAIGSLLDTLLERYPQAENFMLVSHGTVIAAIHHIFAGKWTYVGHATVSKFVEDPQRKGKFHLEFTNDASHLSESKSIL